MNDDEPASDRDEPSAEGRRGPTRAALLRAALALPVGALLPARPARPASPDRMNSRPIPSNCRSSSLCLTCRTSSERKNSVMLA